MSLLKLLNDHLAIITGILTSLMLLVPQARRWVMRIYQGFRNHFGSSKKQDLVLEKLTGIEASIATSGERLAVIESEMRFNGGQTIKDMLFLLFNYRRHDYWRLGIPAMEMDGIGQVTLVSEAACRLFGVVNPDDLKRRSWLRYIEGVDDFLHAFTESVNYQSEFSAILRIRTPDGTSRGDWEMRAAPISQEGSATKIYSAHLSPVDAAAQKAFAATAWSFYPCRNCVGGSAHQPTRQPAMP